jgi:hypothetical protein
VNNSSIYTSTDSGVTFTQRTASGNGYWYALAGSSDLSTIIAANYNGFASVSTDSGATWASQTAPGSNAWVTAAMSSDGTKMFIAPRYSLPLYTRL